MLPTRKQASLRVAGVTGCATIGRFGRPLGRRGRDAVHRAFAKARE